jgi:hypothetical protein
LHAQETEVVSPIMIRRNNQESGDVVGDRQGESGRAHGDGGSGVCRGHFHVRLASPGAIKPQKTRPQLWRERGEMVEMGGVKRSPPTRLPCWRARGPTRDR